MASLLPSSGIGEIINDTNLAGFVGRSMDCPIAVLLAVENLNGGQTPHNLASVNNTPHAETDLTLRLTVDRIYDKYFTCLGEGHQVFVVPIPDVQSILSA